MAQLQTGETINVTVSMNAVTGQYVYTLVNPFDMQINLNNSAASVVTLSGSYNNKISLLNASGVTINGAKGNNIYNVAANAGGLNDNVIHGGTGYDFITLSGSNTQIDLTQGSRGVEAVIGRRSLDGESVTVRLDQLTASALTNGGTGRAFAAIIGSTGEVNVLQTGKFQFVGVVNSADQGFDANGNAITGAALANLLASVTEISNITGNLASIYAGSTTGVIPAKETHIANELNAYVFSDGVKSYTVWTDGTVIPTDVKGNVLAAAYHPDAAVPAVAETYGQVALFDKSANDWAQATLLASPDGLPDVRLAAGSTSATSAIALKSGVTDSIVHGDNGNNGANWFGLGGSGGNNHIFGSKAGNIYDLQQSGSLQDWLTGSTGFDIVRAAAAGADVDLTANNGTTGKASTGIEAVVGSANVNNIQTVELDVGKLQFVAGQDGVKSAVFEAMLGSADDMLQLSGMGKWVEVATFAPGSAAPEHASALVNAELLNAAFGQSQHTAENSLIGHLFEQVDNQGNALKYLTVYTDATVDNLLAQPAAHLLHDLVVL